ncbi:protein TIFY 3A-like [Solanum tuberosum]|uniref:protein TIFY 3A-like n=1 Tax=Solanum tuberosum TaxID=4113 RepID=UPI00073A1246|nr:PREDICTED: protein TIFY 3A-like [Solanum tuberosum]
MAKNREVFGEMIIHQTTLIVARHDDTKALVSQRDKTESEQLTIFYAGVVHVYDNISVQKSIMILARENCNAKEIKPTQKSQVPHHVYKFQADLPIARRKSLKRFFEKRHVRPITYPWKAL